MKKFFIPVVAASLLLCGCDINNTYETYEIVKQGTDMFVDYIDAKKGDWVMSGTEGEPGFYVYQEFFFDEITDFVLDKGAVLVYLVDADGRDNILPYVFPVDNGHDLLMQNIRYDVCRDIVNVKGKDVETGIVTVIIEWQDFRKYAQEDYRFKVCILQPGVENNKK